MTQGRIVLVPFPFDDLVAAKVRPALCLTDPMGRHHHIIVAFISSRISPDITPTDIVIDPHRRDFAATGLRVASVVRLHRLVTLTTGLIRRDMGRLSQSWRNEVDQKLIVLFGLKNA